MRNRDITEKYYTLIDEELEALRESVEADIEKAVVFLLNAMYPQAQVGLDEVIYKFYTKAGSYIDISGMSFRDMLHSTFAGSDFEAEVTATLLESGLMDPTFTYTFKLLGEAERSYEDLFEEVRSGLRDAHDDVGEEYDETTVGFFESSRGREYLSRREEEGDDEYDIYEDYYDSPEYEDYLKEEEADFSLGIFGGFDELFTKYAGYTDLEDFERTVLTNVLDTIQVVYTESDEFQALHLSDFEFEVGLRVGANLQSRRARESARAINSVYTFLNSVKSSFDQAFYKETNQLNLFTGDVDILDLGASVRINNNVRVHMCESFDIAESQTLCVSDSVGEITALLDPAIGTEYQAIIWSHNTTYRCSLVTEYPTTKLTVLTQSGIDCDLTCAPITHIQYVPNAVCKTSNALVAEDIGIDPDTLVTDPEGVDVILGPYPTVHMFTLNEHILVGKKTTDTSVVQVSNPSQPLTFLNRDQLAPSAWVDRDRSMFWNKLPEYIFSEKRGGLVARLRRDPFRRGRTRKIDQPLVLGYSKSLVLGYSKSDPIALDITNPSTLRVSSPNPVSLICLDGVGVYTDLTQIQSAEVRKVPQTPQQSNALILRSYNTVPCDAVVLPVAVSGAFIDVDGLELDRFDEDVSLILDIDAPEDEIAVVGFVELQRDRYVKRGMYTLNPLHYAIRYGSYSRGDFEYDENIPALFGQMLDVRLHKNTLGHKRDLNKIMYSEPLRVADKTPLYLKHMEDLFDKHHPWWGDGSLSTSGLLSLQHAQRPGDEKRLRFFGKSGPLLESAITQHPNFEAFKEDIVQQLKLNVESKLRHKLLSTLGVSGVNLAVEDARLDYRVGEKFSIAVEFRPTFKLAKNINLLAASNLAYVAPQMLGRFEEHAGDNVVLNSAPLGAAMDLYMGKRVSSPNEFLADPEQSIFLEAFTRGALFGQRINELDGKDAQQRYMGGLRYIYSLIDFYTRPLAILYNVLYYPGSYVRENPYVKGKKLLAATYSLKANTWLDAYKEALRVSQRDTSWSHLVDLSLARVADVERELDLWDEYATVYEFDDLFDRDGVSKFTMFTSEESYGDGEILPRDLRSVDIHDKLSRLCGIEENVLFTTPHMREGLSFTDPFGTTRYEEFSRKLNAAINICARNWTFNIAPLLGETYSESSFFETYVAGNNPNVRHVANLSELFNYGVLSSALKKILNNKKVSVGDGKKVRFCGANLDQNAMPYYPIHYALTQFSRVRGSQFGNLPNEDLIAITQKERLSLGAYTVITNLVGITYQEMTRATDSGEFGPSILTANDEYTLTQCTGFVASKRDATLADVFQVSGRDSVVERLDAISRDYNICIGYHKTPDYSGLSARGKADTFTYFDSDMVMFGCIFYKRGLLYEIKGAENSFLGTQPKALKKLASYGRVSKIDVAHYIDLTRAQLIVNFLLYAHTYDTSKYTIDFSCGDVVNVLSVLLPNFNNICSQNGLRRLDSLPNKFRSAFCEALVKHLDIPGIEDFENYVSENYGNLDVDRYLPSLYFVEMKTLLRDVSGIDTIQGAIATGDLFFGVLGATGKLSSEVLRKYEPEAVLTNALGHNPTFDLTSLIEQKSTSELIAESRRRGDGYYYPTKSRP